MLELAGGCELLDQRQELVVVPPIREELNAANELDLDAVVLETLAVLGAYDNLPDTLDWPYH